MHACGHVRIDTQSTPAYATVSTQSSPVGVLRKYAFRFGSQLVSVQQPRDWATVAVQDCAESIASAVYESDQ